MGGYVKAEVRGGLSGGVCEGGGEKRVEWGGM